jgi:serine/threonine protein kinase
VLLSAEGVVKVADFGTVRKGVGSRTHAETGGTHAITRCVAGTRGYMAPEYMERGHVSEKTDAFAFGIVLLELLIGRAPKAVVAMVCHDRDFYKGR